MCSALKQLQEEDDPVLREALRVQMMEFGRTPRQLFTKPHPRRKVSVRGLSIADLLVCNQHPAWGTLPGQPACVQEHAAHGCAGLRTQEAACCVAVKLARLQQPGQAVICRSATRQLADKQAHACMLAR